MERRKIYKVGRENPGGEPAVSSARLLHGHHHLRLLRGQPPERRLVHQPGYGAQQRRAVRHGV